MNKPKLLPLIVCTLLILALSFTSFAQTKAPENASGLLRQAIEAMGGEQQLRSLKTLDITAIGHVNLLEQSERPEGPWIVDYKQIKEVRDLAGERLRVTTESKNQQLPEWNGFTQIVAEGVPAVERGGRSGP